MNRLTHATKSTDLYGSGKHGYTDGVPSVTPATVLNSVAMNPIQEELARAVEAFTTLNSGNLGQLATILTTLLTSAGGSSTLQQSASTPVFATTNDANDHPSSASNKWKLILRMPCSDGTTFARLYAGDGDTTGGFCITWNAVWNPASGAQTWSQDSASYHSSQLHIASTDLRWRGKTGGSSAWGQASWDVRGDYYVGRDLFVARDANITGDLAVTGLYKFATPADREVNIDLASAYGRDFGNVDLTNIGGSIVIAPAYNVVFPVNVPHGCILKGVKVKLAVGGSDMYVMYARRRHAIDYTTAALPTMTTVDTLSATPLAGVVNETGLDFGALTVSRGETYSIHIFNDNTSLGDITLYALSVTISEVQLGVTV